MIYGNSVLFDAGVLGREAPKATIRAPESTDGVRVWALIKSTESLDDNSIYANLLQCTHFASTCAIAEHDGAVVGWVSGHILPEQPDTLFVWQVCVSDVARSQGLGRRLIGDVLSRPVCRAVTTLQCTITHDNESSWGLFTAIARRLDAQMRQVEMFDKDDHFDGHHDGEYGVSIGPFNLKQIAALSSA
ncbi:diaminobutyrate acetyltransferase [Devosia sp. XJ19-1]|uniref:L-2,4-diaminobutyric acid acetyltransferase n=1 Tax=Devosia ureilytica TaxID=2952754 RepID=A0A9Q4AT56_9HYPH|nr:diaminobutyrate acetyltransferase [Devosia ureilytica]MCP8885044.1 diaminobutyrate acetyltransferase [Devosia ureilytica]MCP8889036.1 diaminobutyrate acetyltransferase [Devosia ureilytica]